MNSNKGMDPMLSSFVGDSIWNTQIIADIEIPSGQFLPLTSSDPASPVPDSMLSSHGINASSFTDLASLWTTERKRVTSVKTEDDEGFSDVGSSMMDAEDDDLIHGSISPVPDDASVVEDSGDESVCSGQYTATTTTTATMDHANFLISSEAEARRYVEEKFIGIAHVPNPKSTHKEKIKYILSLSDCKDYTLEHVLNLDKKSSESARVCSKIVQNIPQRYRWECVTPEQIPCCYTIVADCKKTSASRDKPPRPMNAFMIWAQGARRLINELCPKMQNAAISESLGYCWRQKTDAFKKKFELEKSKLRCFHNFEFPEYKYKPKTKVQKAKEKEELSLSKAKLSKTATKRKRPCDNNTSVTPKEPTGRKGRCGRPKKIKLAPEKDQPQQQQQLKLSNSKPLNQQQISPVPRDSPSVKMSPTKPAIKDMLTLKILNDRRTKERAVVVNSPSPSSRDHHHHQHHQQQQHHNNNNHLHHHHHAHLGQLSPMEVESPPPHSDIFDELREMEALHAINTNNTSLYGGGGGGGGGGSRLMSSSVYDTPANTPPVDMMDDDNNTTTTRLSPVHHLKIQTFTSAAAAVSNNGTSTISSSSSSFSPPSSSSSSSHQSQDLSRPHKSINTTKCLLSPQASMPSLTAILSSGCQIPPRNSHTPAASVSSRLPLVHRDNGTHSQHPPTRYNNNSNSRNTNRRTNSNNRLSSTDVFLSCVSEILTDYESESKKDVKPGDFLNRDNNNNNNTSFYDTNNNTITTSFRLWDGIGRDTTTSGSSLSGLSGLLNPKLSMCGPAKIFDFNDLDTLCPDLSVPLLSDDVMSSLMNTL